MNVIGKKIGIMGATFNPIHYGHLMIAEDARNYCKLDEIIFVPSGNSYMKENAHILPGHLRLEMVKLAIFSNPCFSCSDIEIKRGGNTYTYETLSEFHQMYPKDELYFIMGADNLFSVERWKNSEQVLQSCTLIAASRGVVAFESLKKQAIHLEKDQNARVILLPERKMDLSSTEIRQRILKGQSARYMTPERVCDFIGEKQLYTK